MEVIYKSLRELNLFEAVVIREYPTLYAIRVPEGILYQSDKTTVFCTMDTAAETEKYRVVGEVLNE